MTHKAKSILLICPTCGGDTRVTGMVCSACWHSPNYLTMKWYGDAYQQEAKRRADLRRTTKEIDQWRYR